MIPALKGGILTTGPPGKSTRCIICRAQDKMQMRGPLFHSIKHFKVTANIYI